MKTWERRGYRIEEVELDHDLHEFNVIRNEDHKLLGTITPSTYESMKYIIASLNDGEDVDGWDDGMGGTIEIKLKE